MRSAQAPDQGGGAALTREKIIAEASDKVRLHHRCEQAGAGAGQVPLPVEVIPMARSLVARELLRMTGGQPVWREGVTTDNGNWVLDLHNLAITDPVALERELNQIPGVVSVGLSRGGRRTWSSSAANRRRCCNAAPCRSGFVGAASPAATGL